MMPVISSVLFIVLAEVEAPYMPQASCSPTSNGDYMGLASIVWELKAILKIVLDGN